MNTPDLARAIAGALPCVVLAMPALLGTVAAQAQPTASRAAMLNPVIYPARDQSAKQQDQDKYECYDWSKKQSGFDPAQAPPPSAPPSAQAAPAPSSTANASAGVNGSMVRGAAGGAAVAELAHKDAGRGAAVGVLGSAVAQRIKSQQATAKPSTAAQQQQQAQQQMAEQMAAREQLRTNYARAFSACMEARGYVLK
jgi:hypothetical protein